MSRPLPRFVRTKILANGTTAFYWNLTGHYRRLGCSTPNEPLGADYVVACGQGGSGGRAATLNGLFDEWKGAKSNEPVEGLVRFGTVDWLFREYKQTKAYLEKVSVRSRRDYERTMLLVADLVTKRGDRVGDRQIKAITPGSADRIYELVVVGPRGPRQRQGEKVVGLCARRMVCRPPTLPKRLQQGHSKSLARRHEESTDQSIQTSGYPRPGICVCQDRNPGRLSRSGGRCNNLF